MNYRNLFTLSVMLCVSVATKAQELISANFKIADHTTGILYAELTFSNFFISIDRNGDIAFTASPRERNAKSWGDFTDSPYDNRNSTDNLNITRYDSFDSNKSGKIKSIDGVAIDYYGDYDIHDQPGKIKSIGKIKITYNNGFNIHDKAGTIKSIGNINIAYNNGFNIHDTEGTVKSVGPVQIDWYNAFDSDASRGKIKSIKGNTEYVHVTRLSRRR